MRKYIPYIIIGILSIIIIYIYLEKKAESIRHNNNIQAMNDSVTTYIKKYNGLLYQISVKDALILTEKEAKDAAILEVKELKALKIKSVNTQLALEAKIQILKDSLKAKPNTVIEYIKDTSGNVGIKLPFEYEYSDKFAYLSSGVKQDKTSYINAQIYLDGKFIIGFQKDGLFKTKPVGVFVTENPYITTTNIVPVIITQQKQWYEKWWVHVLGGAILGGFGTYKIIQLSK